MLARLLDGSTRGARRAAVVAIALAVGVVVGASALAGHPTRLVTVADGSSSTAASDAEHSGKPSHASKPEKTKPEKTKPAKPSKPSKPSEAAGTGDDGSEAADGDTHGSCVAAVAQDKTKVGGPHHNHGFAVSRAAHTCPHPQPSGT